MLSKQTRIVLDTLLPSEAHPRLKSGIFDTDFDAFWSDVERTALPAWRWGFYTAVWAANWIAPLLIRRLPPLNQYDRQTRERALAAMETSRVYFLRQMMGLLKTIVCFGYGADRNVRDAIGYPRQPEEPRPQELR
jgi:hypothetical protein